MIGVPADSKFEAAAYIGSSAALNEGVLVDFWYADTQHGKVFLCVLVCTLFY